MSLKIRSVNVRAIGDNAKRREVFNWLRAKNFSIYMIQEAHCTENKSHIWRAEWRFQSIFSYCTSAKAGVGILFNNNFKLKVLKTFSDPEGRFIITDIETDERKLTLANIYAPNDDNPRCFRKIYDHFLNFSCEEIIMGGDSNLVFDTNKDKRGGQPRTHRHSLKIVQDTAQKLDLMPISGELSTLRNPEIYMAPKKSDNSVQTRFLFN